MHKPARTAMALALAGVLSLTGGLAAWAETPDDTPSDEIDALAEPWEELLLEYFTSTEDPILDRELLASANPDECWAGLGLPYPEGTVESDGSLSCPDGSVPRTNQAYVWGLAKAGDDLFFGTGPNIHCLVQTTYLGVTAPSQTDSWVCEAAQAAYRDPANNPLGAPLPAAIGDWRPPDLYVYRQQSGELVDLGPELDTAGRNRLNSTLGIRSAGAIDGRVFLAGPTLANNLAVFVFDEDGSFIGSENVPGYINIRKWVEVDGELYTGVRTSGDRGAVLHYTGSSPSDPFQFEVVGDLDTEAAELAEHDGRLYVSTWPTPSGSAGLWMSPPLGDGLTPADTAGWEEVWSVHDYEPDPVTAATYGGGALVSYEGELYWGTMHVPGTGILAHILYYDEFYDSASAEDLLLAALGSWRAISLFRGDNFDSSPEFEVLYGLPEMPVFDGSEWTIQPNNMGGIEPTFGFSGFGNPFNNYTWTMDVFDGSLYVGTMDWVYLIESGLEGLFPADIAAATEGGVEAMAEQVPLPHAGADLWRFDSADNAAVAETLDGVGNELSYGIRTMVSDDALYLGMANPMNLEEDGGWQLIKLGGDETLAATGADPSSAISLGLGLLLAGALLAALRLRRREAV